MVTPTTWVVSVMRYFIESKGKKTKKGTPVMFPMDVRKILLSGDFIVTKHYQCTLVKRKGDISVSVKQLIEPQKPKWPCPLIDKPQASKWVKEGSYSIAKFTEWLGKRIPNAAAVVSEMQTAPPENLAA
jgi:hypothetical protein